MNAVRTLCCALALSLCAGAGAQTAMHVDLRHPGAVVQPTMYGLFFEDINSAADGGIYAELIENRSFEFANPLEGWRAAGRFEVRDDGPFERNPHYVRLAFPGHPHKYSMLVNEGFFGISYEKGASYKFSVWARAPFGGRGRIAVELVDASGLRSRQPLVGADIIVDSEEWHRYELTLTTPEEWKDGAIRVILRDRETVDVEHVSLFPADTWKERPGGLRRDLVQSLADLKPGVLRFPGGCIVEGTEMPDRYQWKNTVGPVENRPTNLNRWQYTFRHHLFPDYYQSGGLGFYEYFLLAEDIGAEALPVLNCGMVCQYQNDSTAHCSLSEIDAFVQDALDLVEFANGDVSTTWGALRAEMGHPEPFGMKFLAVGNEQWGPEYVEHLVPFMEALRAKCPEIKVVGTAGPKAEGPEFDYLWPEMKRLGVDLVDEHFYLPAEWFLSQGARYDSYDRKGPKVFAGEYACHIKGRTRNNFEAALCEAALMTGMERNADVVHMTSYAPLFARVDGWQWRPDLIWFDNTRVMRTSSYYVQQLYMHYRGERVLSLTSEKQPLTGQNGLFASAVLDGDKVYVKVANTTDEEQALELSFEGLKKKRSVSGVECISLHSDDLAAENSLDEPDLIAPVRKTLDFQGTAYTGSIGARTFCLYIFQL